ncbi:MAG: hypothetical protein K2J08_00395 [Ruminococcus sp.]|nr:hypothetical protein [Ruminococcus sp.]
MNEKFFIYKGYPLVRSGNTIYYGNMSDPYVTMIQILAKNKSGDMEVTSKVRVVQMSTDLTLSPIDACIKNTECECGLYEALDIARVWLEKALKK